MKPIKIKVRDNNSSVLNIKSCLWSICIIFLGFSSNLRAQSPQVNWSSISEDYNGSSFATYIMGTCTDRDGNYYVTGSFSSDSLKFGDIKLMKPGSGSGATCFLVKFDALGNAIWGKAIGTAGDFTGTSVCSDVNGNIILAGNYKAPSIQIGTIILTNMGLNDIFLIKYDNAGNVIWVQNAGGDESESNAMVTTDAASNIYLAFQFRSQSISIGNQTYSNFTQVGFASDIALVKYNSDGAILWSRHDGGDGSEEFIYGMSTDSLGNSYLVGKLSPYISETVTYSFAPLTVTSNSGEFTFNLYIVKYDSFGAVQWIKNSESGKETAYDVSADNKGNVAFTGVFFGNQSFTLGNVTVNNTNPSLSGQILTAKLNSNGDVLWMKNEGGTGVGIGMKVEIDHSENIIVGGVFFRDPITIGTTILQPLGTEADFAVLKYDSNGQVLWAESIQSNGAEHYGDICVSPNNDVLISGMFDGGELTYGSTTITNSSPGKNDLFLINLKGDRVIAKTLDLNQLCGVTVYPNPTNNLIKVVNPFEKNMAATIYEISGKVISVLEIKPGDNTFALNDLASGIYWLVVNDRIIQSRVKIIKN